MLSGVKMLRKTRVTSPAKYGLYRGKCIVKCVGLVVMVSFRMLKSRQIFISGIYVTGPICGVMTR